MGGIIYTSPPLYLEIWGTTPVICSTLKTNSNMKKLVAILVFIILCLIAANLNLWKEYHKLETANNYMTSAIADVIEYDETFYLNVMVETDYWCDFNDFTYDTYGVSVEEYLGIED
jgi:hypothetical protein